VDGKDRLSWDDDLGPQRLEINETNSQSLENNLVIRIKSQKTYGRMISGLRDSGKILEHSTWT
jgi:hypothetical protein